MYGISTDSITKTKIKLTQRLVLELFLWVLVLAFLTLQLYRPEIINRNDSLLVLLTNYFIIVLSIVFMVFGDPFPFSLNKIFMFFCLFFFGIAPCLQYQRGITFWSNTPFSSHDYLRTNLIVLLILVFYQATYSLAFRIKSFGWKRRSFDPSHENANYSLFFLFLIAFVSALITLHVKDYSLQKLLFRSLGATGLTQPVMLVYMTFIRPLPAIVLLIFKQIGRRNNPFECLLWSIVLLTNFPTATPRYYAAVIYLPLIIVYFRNFFSQNYLLLNKFLVIGLFTVFPFLDQFRRIDHLTQINHFVDLGMFTQGHFDSFQMLMKISSENFIAMGRQLTGVLFFFVPRSIWQNKPSGSGHLIAEKFGYNFSNISMNYFGEGYINFGFLGILFFILFIAFFNSSLDKTFWRKGQGNAAFSIFYFILIAMEVFILRGDLMSSFAYTVGMTVSLVFVIKINMFARRFQHCFSHSR